MSSGSLGRWARGVLGAGREVLFPSVCVHCGEPERGYPLCPACEGMATRASAEPWCTLCGGLLGVDDAGCQRCHDKGLPHLERVWRWTAYEGPVRSMVLRCKFARDWTLAEWMGTQLARSLVDAQPGHFDEIVPVPQHLLRTLRRGFNPADRIASELAAALGVRRVAGLRRVRATDVQSRQVGRAGRARNVSGAFACRPRSWGSVLLVDDVLTSGATAVECARALKRAGAKRVEVACVAVADPRVHDGEV